MSQPFPTVSPEPVPTEFHVARVPDIPEVVVQLAIATITGTTVVYVSGDTARTLAGLLVSEATGLHIPSLVTP